ncbi:MAG TPA: L-threonylcarbamoyladenylate synthase [Acidimicrobiales bacterium]|jgi:L-threonylcarbamoyladenylate synthase|nr:L-threonylcarbamoyladenylate synthase [Acidimicrobiales bacterium]
MRTLHVDDEGTLAAAAEALMAGEAIVVPTDTVYGVAARPDLADAVHRIYLAKDRPQTMHLPILAASLDQVRALGVHLSDTALILAERWWPGPLTMALGFAVDGQRPAWLADRDEVAVRIPRHLFLLDLLARTGVLMVTSANRHGAPTPPSAAEVLEHLTPHVSMLIDGGTLEGEPSTLVNVHGGDALVEREGAISRATISSVLPPRRDAS